MIAIMSQSRVGFQRRTPIVIVSPVRRCTGLGLRLLQYLLRPGTDAVRACSAAHARRPGKTESKPPAAPRTTYSTRSLNRVATPAPRLSFSPYRTARCGCVWKKLSTSSRLWLFALGSTCDGAPVNVCVATLTPQLLTPRAHSELNHGRRLGPRPGHAAR